MSTLYIEGSILSDITNFLEGHKVLINYITSENIIIV